MKTELKGAYALTTFILLIVASSSLVLAEAENNKQNNIENSTEQYLLLPPQPVRNIAEFERMEGVLINYGGNNNFGISYSIIAEMAEDIKVITIVDSASQKSQVQTLFQNHGVNLENCDFLIAPSDSWWTRDYGPWFIFNGNDELAVIDFKYNRDRPNDNAIPLAFAVDQGLSSYYMDLTHTGGNYMTDGLGISVSTDLVWTENSGKTHNEIDEIVEDYLGITNYHVVDDVLGAYIEHIDCWAKYLSPDTIMIIEVQQSDPHYNDIREAVEYFENQTSCYGTPYQIERVYTHTTSSSGLPYINSLILNNKVLVPISGSQWDDDALESYENAMPGYEVHGFTGSWYSTDALHCRTKGIPDRYMLYIEHNPLSGTQYAHSGVNIEAQIIPYSGQSLISNSTFVFWKEDGGDWDSVKMTPLGNDSYNAVIYPQEEDSTVYYYIHAEDNSGRIENHPFIGESDAHSFIAHINDPPEDPATPTGNLSGTIETFYNYSTSTIDPDGDQVFFMWDWGDDTFSKWLGPYDSGEIVWANHTWDEEGNYYIKVKSKDTFGEESDWSNSLKVKMPINKAYNINQLFLRFLHRHPNLYLLLKHLLGML